MYHQYMALQRQLDSFQRTRFAVRTIGHNVPTLSRPTRHFERDAYRLASGRAHRGIHPLDRFERKQTRFFGWDIPALIGLSGSLGSPGLGFASATMTSICWALALGGSGVSHITNGVRCGRRRSLWSGPVFVMIGGAGLVWGTGRSLAMWDNLWAVAFVVWSYWFLHDRRRPHRRYRSHH
jgi:hypothetical protein